LNIRFFDTVAPLRRFMAEDLVLEWQNVLRDSITDQHPDVNDLLLLDLATKFGAVDPYSKEPVSRHYRKPSTVTEKQILTILDGLQAQFRDIKIDPMTPIGPMAATSISEPIYQGGMRTFHYAGVLTKKDALQLLNIEVGNIPNKNALIAVALPPETRFNENAVKQIAEGLTRSVLGDYVGVIKNHPGYRQLVLSDAVGKAERAMRGFPHGTAFDIEYEEPERNTDGMTISYQKRRKSGVKLDDVRMYNKELYDRISNAMDEKKYTGEEYSKEYQELINTYRQMQQLFAEDAVEAGKSDSFFIYLKHDGEIKDGTQRLNIDQLNLILRRQLKTSDGMFRTVGKEDNPLHLIWKNAKLEQQTVQVGDKEYEGIAFTFPFLTSRLKIGFMETILRLEFCNNCHRVSTLAKLVHKAGRKGTGKVVDDSWDTDRPTTEYNATAVASLLEEADVRKNPPLTDEELEDLQDEAVGLIEIDMSTSDRYDFEIAELGRKIRCCSNCGMGWYNVQTSVVPFNFGPSYEDFEETNDDGQIADYKFEDLNRDIDIMKHIGSLKADTVYPDEVGFVSYPGASRQGQNSDYPLAFMHGGRLINDPIMDEFYILVNYKDVNDGRMNNFKGHFQTASLSDFIDFDRTTTSDAKQVELVLGIEAARTQLAHNMFNAQGNGDTIAVAGNSSPVLYKHYLLLADTLTSGIKITNARAGSGSVSGAAANKGRRTEIVDGEPVYYSSVLAQAYERQTQVLLQAAPLGLVDDLNAPVSAQVAGQPERRGTTGGATTGKYASVPTVDLINKKSVLAGILNQVNQYSFEKIGRTWAGEAQSLSSFISEVGEDEFGIGAIVRQQADTMLQDEDFVALLEEWRIARDDLEQLLESHDL